MYVVYRWIITLLFFAYLLKTGIESKSLYFLEYLTVWGLITLVLYSIWSSATVTYTFIYKLILKKPSYYSNRFVSTPTDNTAACCNYTGTDSISWYHKVLWVFFTISTETAFGITLLFWTVLYPRLDLKIGDDDIFIHLLNGLSAYFDLWITGIPVRIYHFYIPCIFGCIYSAFTGIHYVTLVVPNTTAPIYPVLDYGTNPTTAIAFATLVPLVISPLIHLFFFGSYLLRQKILFKIKRNCRTLSDNETILLLPNEEDNPPKNDV